MIAIDLSGKNALITGGAAGIGYGCCEVLARAGAHVLVADINFEAAVNSTEKLKALGYKASAYSVDIRSQASICSLMQKLNEDFNSIDILVNNAGNNLFKGLEDTTVEEWDQLMDLDLKGIFLMIKAALPLLKVSGDASIISISSNHTKSTIANIYAYATAKAGVTGMAKSLCQELGVYGIRVNTLSPGFTRTPLYDRWIKTTENPGATEQAVLDYHPLKKIATTIDVGYAVAFLSSNMASNITGSDLVLDGGLSVRLMH